MKYIFLDLETFYSKTYSLRVMTPIEYALDPQFEPIGCGIAEGMGQPFWLPGYDLKDYLAKQDPAETALISHNALFDMSVVAWRFGYTPRLMIDTMSMSRALLYHQTKSISLERIGLHLGLGVKGKTVHNVIGMSAAAIKAAGLYDDYVAYCLNDVELCRKIFFALKSRFPVSEFVVHDTVIRCAITPKFKLNANLLAEHLAQIQADKAALLARTGMTDRDSLMSDDKFAAVLRSLGVEPPTKVSPKTGKTIYAFAKTDVGMIELEEHPNSDVQALIAARLGFKSTLEETRTQRLLTISQLTLPGKGVSFAPIPLRNNGAHTHRLSGDWKLNMQNLPRGGRLRHSLEAPEGYKVLAVDASQIEARLVAWLAGQDDLVKQFARGEDVYSAFAGDIYGRPINRKLKIPHPETGKLYAPDEAEGALGKEGILGLGFGMGADKFCDRVRIRFEEQGIPNTVDIAEAARVVGIYRNKYLKIKETWRFLNNAIPLMAQGDPQIQFGPVRLGHKVITGPSGLQIFYDDLQYKPEWQAWAYTYAGKWKRLYGAKMLENIVQFLDREHVLSDAMIRIRKLFSALGSDEDLGLAHQVHDELIYVVPDELVEVCKRIALEEMSRVASWAVGLPLAAEAHVGQSYGAAK